MRRIHAVLVPAIMLIAFASCEATTGARRVEFDTSVMGVGGSEPFENVPPDGVEPWTVSLEEAWIALGPVYLFEGEPLLGRLYHALVMPRAFAHPGHYQEGEALGEALDQRVIDLLASEPTRLGVTDAVTGQCRSARLGIGTPEEGLEGADHLDGHAVLLRGLARRDAEEVPFEAWLDIDLYVEGISFEHDLDGSPGGLLVEVDLTRWLRRVDFATATQREDTYVFEEGSQAHNALSRGVDNTLAYGLSWAAENDG